MLPRSMQKLDQLPVQCPWMSINQSVSNLSMKKCYVSMKSYLSLTVTQITLRNNGSTTKANNTAENFYIENIL